MNLNTKIKLVTDLLAPEFFGFFSGHREVAPELPGQMEELLRSGSGETVAVDYEQGFARLIGGGQAVSFAAARMAFYTAMKLLGIKEGDEILLTGFTCSVMANAIWRMGATPVYADIDPGTFGTDPKDVERKLTARTRMIVAQHSFGIPCAIDEIAEIAKRRGIFLLEDCALSVGSRMRGTTVGEWGDAAIFSTDHSKPLNTMTGGMLYTRDASLAARAREYQQSLPELSPAHQRRLWRRFLVERRWFHPHRYALGRLLAKASTVPSKLRKRWSGLAEHTLLEGDFKPRLQKGGYPYPARLPAFLARLGLEELRRWTEERRKRQERLARYLELANEVGLREFLPPVYHDAEREIVPLRFIYTHPQAKEIIRRMSRRIETDWIWFQEPIVCAPQGPASFQYTTGACPQAERVGGEIVNWPCVLPADMEAPLFKFFREVHTGLSS